MTRAAHGAGSAPPVKAPAAGGAAAAPGRRLRRRDALLAAGLAVVGAAVLPSRALAADEGALLSGLWQREMGAALAYGLALAWVPQLAPIWTHESDHAAGIATELAAVGLATPSPPKGLDEIDIAAQELAGAKDRKAVLAAAEDLEQGLVEAYRMALPLLQDPKIAMTVATILGSHAQHLLIVRRNAGVDPLASE